MESNEFNSVKKNLTFGMSKSELTETREWESIGWNLEPQNLKAFLSY